MDTIWLATALFLALSMAATGYADTEANDTGEDAIFARSLVSMGDTARVQKALAKARRGEPVVVSVIGGSITGGAAASKPENRYGNRIAKWWREQFPQAEIKFVNAGIGATGSNIGAHRAQDHLLKHKPDFVVVEYGVNDPNSEFAAETLEGLVRQILKLPNQPGVALLFTMNRAGGNAQEWHSKIGRHYALPMVSFRDALWPEIEAERIKWEDVEGDEVHPNDRGHKYCADFVTAALATILAKMPEDAKLPAIKPMPAPLISDVFEYATLFNQTAIAPTTNEGWTTGEAWPFGPCWESETPGSVLEFEVEGTSVALTFHRIKRDMGIAQAQVDDAPPVKMNAWFSAEWGGYSAWNLIARDLAPGKHTLRIKLLEEKAEESSGHKFQVQALMVAGLPH